MAFHQPVLIQPGSGDPSLVTPGQDFRNYTSAALSAGTGLPFNSTNWSGGVPDAGWASNANTGSLVVTQRGAGANFSVDVSSGWVYIIGTDVSGQGVYAAWNDATVNVTTPSAPGSGSRAHRLIARIQDKFSNGTWTGYQCVFELVQDTGSGFPNPSPNASYTTLAQVNIAAGQVSVQNANIVDLRRSVGPVVCFKPSNTSRSSTSISSDPDLQLWGLADSATYHVTGMIFYHGTAMTVSSDPGGLTHTFVTTSGGSGTYSAFRANATNNVVGWQPASNWTGSLNSHTDGSSQTNAMKVEGFYSTGSTRPSNFLIFQWGMSNSGGTTVVEGSSGLRAVRVA